MLYTCLHVHGHVERLSSTETDPISLQDWQDIVSLQQHSMTWNQALMCLSEFGDILSESDPKSKARLQHAPDQASLYSSVESLVDVIRQTQPLANTTRTADVGHLGAGLVTSSQLMVLKYGNADMRKGLQRQAHQLQDALVSQSREYLASQLPDSSRSAAAATSLQEPAQSLLVVCPQHSSQDARIQLIAIQSFLNVRCALSHSNI